MLSLRRFWRPATGFFLVLWLFLLLVGQTRLLRDPGTFWHTVLGEKMLTTGQLVRGDPFSFTFNDAQQHPWIPHQWLGECLMAVLHRIDGLDTLLLATATILAGLYAWLAHRLVRAGLHWAIAAVIVILVLAASSSHFHARPHLATIVFLGTTFAFLCDFEAGRISLARCLWLVPVYLFWTSVHGGMLGGVATMIAVVAGWCLWRMLGWESPFAHKPDAQARGDAVPLTCASGLWQLLGWIALIAACGLTAFVNPYGAELPRTWLAIMGQPLHEIIVEHARLDPLNLNGFTVLLLGVVYIAALLSLPRRPRATWLLPLLWLGLACTGVRHAPLFAITAGLGLAEVLPHTRWADWQVRSGGDLYVPPKATERYGWQPLLLPVLAVATALGLQIARVEVPLIGHGWARLDPGLWPEELRLELEDLNRTQPKGTPIFNDLSFGGYLIYVTRESPNLRIFVDDRCELYGYPWLKQYVDADDRSGAPEAIHRWERTYPVFSLALVRSGSGFDDYFHESPDWEPVKTTRTASLYRRKETPKLR